MNTLKIEVKSSANYGLSSLNKFSAKFGEYVGCRYVLHTGELRVEPAITYLPLYMAHLL